MMAEFMVKDRDYLELAFLQAEKSLAEGTIPIGAVVVGPDGEVISCGRNAVFTRMDQTCHAEMDALRLAGPKLMDAAYKNRCTIYSTVEPCPMCMGAILMTGISRAVWALNDDYLGAARAIRESGLFKSKLQRIELVPMPDFEFAMRALSLHEAYEQKSRHGFKASGLFRRTIEESFQPNDESTFKR